MPPDVRRSPFGGVGLHQHTIVQHLDRELVAVARLRLRHRSPTVPSTRATSRPAPSADGRRAGRPRCCCIRIRDMGGDRFNNVVSELYRALPAAGVAAVRFDFSGSGARHRTAAEAARRRRGALLAGTGDGRFVVGYSFGGRRRAARSTDARLAGWFLVAPAAVDGRRRPIGGRSTGRSSSRRAEHDQFFPLGPAADVADRVGWRRTSSHCRAGGRPLLRRPHRCRRRARCARVAQTGRTVMPARRAPPWPRARCARRSGRSTRRAPRRRRPRPRRRRGGRACRRRRWRSPARCTASLTARVSSRSKPSRVPSRSIDVSRISPAPQRTRPPRPTRPRRARSACGRRASRPPTPRRRARRGVDGAHRRTARRTRSAISDDQLGPLDRRGVHRHLVGAGPQQPAGVVDRPDAAADGERDEHLLGRAAGDVDHRVAPVGRRGDVEEDELVRALARRSGPRARRGRRRRAGRRSSRPSRPGRRSTSRHGITRASHASAPTSTAVPRHTRSGPRRAPCRRSRRPAADRRLETASGEVVEAADAARLAITGTRGRGRAPRASPSRSGPASVPSREMSVTTNASTPASANRASTSSSLAPAP